MFEYLRWKCVKCFVFTLRSLSTDTFLCCCCVVRIDGNVCFLHSERCKCDVDFDCDSCTCTAQPPIPNIFHLRVFLWLFHCSYPSEWIFHRNFLASSLALYWYIAVMVGECYCSMFTQCFFGSAHWHTQQNTVGFYKYVRFNKYEHEREWLRFVYVWHPPWPALVCVCVSKLVSVPLVIILVLSYSILV